MAEREDAKQGLRGFVERIIDQHFLKPLIGKVISKTDEDLEITIFGLLEQNEHPTFKWSDGIFYRLDDFWLEINDDLFIVPINGTFVITGRITKKFPKLRDRIRIPRPNVLVLVLEDLVDTNIVGFELETTQTLHNPLEEEVLKTVSWYGKFGDMPDEFRLSIETDDVHNYEIAPSLGNVAPPVDNASITNWWKYGVWGFVMVDIIQEMVDRIQSWSGKSQS